MHVPSDFSRTRPPPKSWSVWPNYTRSVWPALDTVKYEEVYLKDYAGFADAVRNLAAYFRFYNRERLHQALGYRTPASVYRTAA